MGNSVKIGIIGYGKFGKLLYRVADIYKKKNSGASFKVLVYSKGSESNQIPDNSRAASLRDLVNESNFIIPCVPIRKFEEVIEQLSVYLRPKSTVLDVCSVKEYPVRIMKRYLPKDIDIVATHPMFGPGSYAYQGNLKDLNIVIYPIKDDLKQLRKTQEILKEIGLNVINLKPREHDRLIASSQFVAWILTFLLRSLNLQKGLMKTDRLAKALLELDKAVTIDFELVKDLIKYNSFAFKEIRKIQKWLGRHSQASENISELSKQSARLIPRIMHFLINDLGYKRTEIDALSAKLMFDFVEMDFNDYLNLNQEEVKSLINLMYHKFNHLFPI